MCSAVPGWNVIKVIWGSRSGTNSCTAISTACSSTRWPTTVDGEYQRYGGGGRCLHPRTLLWPDPRLRKLVEQSHRRPAEADLPRGGHDYQKVYAAFKAASEVTRGQPTVILAKTSEGVDTGRRIRGPQRNPPDQEDDQRPSYIDLRSADPYGGRHPRVESLEDGDSSLFPALAPTPRNTAVHGGTAPRPRRSGCPTRVIRDRRPMRLSPHPGAVSRPPKGFGRPRSLHDDGIHRPPPRPVARPACSGSESCPSCPTRPAPSAWTHSSANSSIYAPTGSALRAGRPRPAPFLLRERATARSSRKALPSVALWPAGSPPAPSYANTGVPMVPFFTFYSMFGFQRVGDSLWAAADARTRGFLLGATAGRTTLMPAKASSIRTATAMILASDRAGVRGLRPRLRVRTRGDHARTGFARMYPERASNRRRGHPTTTSPSTTRTTSSHPDPTMSTTATSPAASTSGTTGPTALRAGDDPLFGPGQPRCSRGTTNPGRGPRHLGRTMERPVIQTTSVRGPRCRTSQPSIARTRAGDADGHSQADRQ